MQPTRGQVALITGASSGIGEGFTRALAARGMQVVLVARSGDRLQALATELMASHGVQAHVLPCDLSRPTAAAQLLAETQARGLAVDWLINNAGFGTYGHFEAQPPEREAEEVALNVGAVVALAHAFVPGMLERSHGAIINVASTAAFQGVPYMAVYAATKAFVLSFSDALAEEYRGRGVHVQALCPGPTETGFFDVAGSRDGTVGGMRRVDDVIASSLHALARNRVVAVDGPGNWLRSVGTRLAPRWLAARIAGELVKPQ